MNILVGEVGQEVFDLPRRLNIDLGTLLISSKVFGVCGYAILVGYFGL